MKKIIWLLGLIGFASLAEAQVQPSVDSTVQTLSNKTHTNQNYSNGFLSQYTPQPPFNNSTIGAAATLAGLTLGGGQVIVPECSYTATFSGSVMTVTSVGNPGCSLAAGGGVWGVGVPVPTYITTLGTGTGGLGTYNLSNSPSNAGPEKVDGTIQLTAALPVYSGIQYIGQGYSVTQALMQTTVGTVLQGNGNNSGGATFDAFDYDNTDLGTPPTVPSTFLNGMVQGFGVQNMTLMWFNYGIKIGGLYNPGCNGCTFSNLSSITATSWSYWFENFINSTFSNVYSSYGLLGQAAFGSSGFAANSNGNSQFYGLVAQYGSSLSQRGWLFFARGGGGGLDILYGNGIQANVSGRASNTQAATMTASSANISVPNASIYAIDQPVVFSAAVNGLSALTTYYVTSVNTGTNVITVALLQYGTNLAPTNIVSSGSAAVNITTYGFPNVEFVGYGTSAIVGVDFTGLDLEAAGGGVSNSAVQIQNTRDIHLQADYTSAGSLATVVGRHSDGFSYVGTEYTIAGVSYDWDATYGYPMTFGAVKQLTPVAGNSNFVSIGTPNLSCGSTDTRATTCAGLLNLSGKYTSDAYLNKNGQFIDFANFPIGAKTIAYANGATIGTGNGQTSNVECPTSGSNSLVLPLLAANGDGIWLKVSNPSTGTCTLTSQSSQIILANGTSATSIVIPGQSRAEIGSVSAASPFWTAEYYSAASTPFNNTVLQGGLAFVTPPSGYMDATGNLILGQVPNAAQTVSFSATAGATVGGTIATTGTAGQFSYTTGTGLAAGDYIVITGTLGGTGTVVGYSTGTMYYVSAVGSGTFTLQTSAQGAIVTTAGTITGLTFTPYVGVAFSAATLTGTSAGDVTRRIIVQQGSGPYTYIDCVVNVYVSNAAAACTLSGTLSGTGPYTPLVTGTNLTTNTAGANAQTYSVPLQNAYANSFVYLPASSAFGAPGNYFCQWSTPAIAQCNTLASSGYTANSGTPTIPGSPVAPSGLTPGTYTQTINAALPGPSVNIASGSLLANGQIRYKVFATTNNDADNKFAPVRFNSGTVCNASAFTSGVTLTLDGTIANNAATSSQVASCTFTYANSMNTVAPTRLSVATGSGAYPLAFDTSLAVATDEIVLEYYSASEYPN